MPLSAETFFSTTEASAPPEYISLEKIQNTLDALQTPQKEFAERAVHSILEIAKKLDTSSGLWPSSADLHESIFLWLTDKAHGVIHSYDVFQRALELRNAERAAQQVEYDISDEELEMRAILHDIGEFLPVYDATGKKRIDKSYQARKHPQIISLIVRKIARELHADDAHQLAIDLRHHDHYWNRPSRENAAQMKQRLSPAGQLLADGDRLVGEDVATAIARSGNMAVGKSYLIKDFPASERATWKTRTFGLFDGLSALFTEFVGEEYWLYTDAGKKLNKEKQEKFQEVLISYYQDRYQKGWEILEKAREEKQPIQIGIKGEVDGNQNAVTKTPTGIEVRSDMSDAEMRAVFEKLINIPVPSTPNTQFPNREYFGYALQVNGDVWLDPSLLRFASKEALAAEFVKSIEEYRKFFATQPGEEINLEE